MLPRSILLLAGVVIACSPAPAPTPTTPASTPTATDEPTPVPSVTATPSGEGRLIYQAWDGGQTSTLVVTSSGGEELGRIELPTAPRAGIALPAEQRALYLADDGRQFLVNAQDLTVTQLDLPGDASDSLRLGGPDTFPTGRTHAILVSTQLDQAYLIDLETGEAYDLRTAFDAPFLAGVWAPNEDQLLLMTGAGLWLVPTAQPQAARQVGTSGTGSDVPIGFTEGGEQIVYAHNTGAGGYEMVVEDGDGSDQRTIATVTQLRGWKLLGQRGILLVQPGAGSMLSIAIADGSTTELPQLPGIATVRFQSSPGEDRVLARVEEEGGETVWRLIDVASSHVTDVPALSGFALSLTVDPYPWLLLSTAVPTSGESFALAGFDFETGEATPLLELPLGAHMTSGPSSTADGRLAAFVVFGSDGRQLPWLLDLDASSARQLPCADTCPAAAPSPDGSWIAIVEAERHDTVSSPRVTLVATEGQQTIVVGDGHSPIWVMP